MSIPIFLRPRNHIVRNSKKSGSGRHKPTERKKKRSDIDNFNDIVLEWNEAIRQRDSNG
jgi:hypothetical protein